MTAATKTKPALSVVVPIYNEAECVEQVMRELFATLDSTLDFAWEVLAVDDGSTDATPVLLRELAAVEERVRILRISPNSGQSAAFWAGFQAARGEYIATMDADGQNDPRDIALCLGKLGEADLCCGYRAKRKDTLSKRWGSKLANRVRSAILNDGIRDTGCSMKVFKSGVLKPLQHWDGMHRFLPALVKAGGARIEQIPVGHRARSAGTSKYSNWGRLKRTVRDLFGVGWLVSRSRVFSVSDETPQAVEGK